MASYLSGVSRSADSPTMPATLAAWRRRRRGIRRTLTQLFGAVPPRPRPVAATRIGRREMPDYTREDLVLDDGVGGRIPMALVLPHGARPPWPVILYHHSHWGDYSVGLDEIFEPWPVRETPARAFARRGWAVASIDARAFGARQGQGPGGPSETGYAEEQSLTKAFLWQGTSLWAMMVRDDLIALDYVAGRSDLDHRRIGATGMSMGSTRSWWLAALDDRVRVAACVACLTQYRALLRHRALARHGIYYFLPGMLRHFDTEAVLGLIAPRPLLTVTGARDAGSPADGVRALHRFCRGLWALHGRDRNFRGRLDPGVGHAYTRDMWNQVVAWFDVHL
jgi:dienelactone hydrolase